VLASQTVLLARATPLAILALQAPSGMLIRLCALVAMLANSSLPTKPVVLALPTAHLAPTPLAATNAPPTPPSRLTRVPALLSALSSPTLSEVSSSLPSYPSSSK